MVQSARQIMMHLQVSQDSEPDTQMRLTAASEMNNCTCFIQIKWMGGCWPSFSKTTSPHGHSCLVSTVAVMFLSAVVWHM